MCTGLQSYVYQEFISCIRTVHCGFATVVGKSEEKNAVVKGFSVQLNCVCECVCVYSAGEKKRYLETNLSRVHLIWSANEISEAKNKTKTNTQDEKIKVK